METMLLPSTKFMNQNLCVHPSCIDCITTYMSKFLVRFRIVTNFWNQSVARILWIPICLISKYFVLGLTRCYYPNLNCSALILDEGGGVATGSKCPNCKRLFCF
ncbi:hypothetical protein EJD97_022874 [Solanum chilense]|uniref:IBR domain-containing protein n=1 Tax=Solanum chilense TaxID=4083 RepID=A0A6N2AVH8_SOLCI|nr:hypothetical protein EJD97_022874 [Solanum chilense]